MTALMVGQACSNLMTNPANKLVTRLQLSAQGTVRRVVEHVRARYMAILEIELPDDWIKRAGLAASSGFLIDC